MLDDDSIAKLAQQVADLLEHGVAQDEIRSALEQSGLDGGSVLDVMELANDLDDIDTMADMDAKVYIDEDGDGDIDMTVERHDGPKGGGGSEPGEEPHDGSFVAETPEERAMLGLAGGRRPGFEAETPEEREMMAMARGVLSDGVEKDVGESRAWTREGRVDDMRRGWGKTRRQQKDEQGALDDSMRNIAMTLAQYKY